MSENSRGAFGRAVLRDVATRAPRGARRDSAPCRADGQNPRWGYTPIQGALKNVGHRVARSTIAAILKAEGNPPSGERPTAWRTFLRAHWPALVAADFFTTEVWTARGLVTYYTMFIIELQSRRVHVAGSTRYPDEAFVTFDTPSPNSWPTTISNGVIKASGTS